MSRWNALRRGYLGAGAALLAAAQPGTGIPLPQGNPTAPATSQQTAPAPAVRVSTRLVQISVIAEDKHGKPVTDLSQEDFRLLDNGQEQKLAFFSMQSSQALPPAQSQAEATPADAWTNTPKSRGGVPVNLTVILFDGLNTKLTDQQRVREQIVRLLSQVRPQERVALYALGLKLYILHEFTGDTTALLRTLSKYPGYEGPHSFETPMEASNLPLASKPLDIDGSTSAAIDMFLTNPDALVVQSRTVDRVLRTMDAMQAIAAHLAGLPGRKSLLWVSGAFPLHLENESLTTQTTSPTDSRQFTDQLGQVARALDDANVAVYPVDARGLYSNAVRTFSSGQSGTPGRSSAVGPASSPRAPASPLLAPDAQAIGTMREIAARTGGEAFYFSNDIRGALREAMDDSRVVYTLAYVPTHDDWKGEFRKVKVEVSRKDVHLRYRTGYFAVPDTPLDETLKQRLLAEAQWSTLESTEISLTVHANRITADGKPAVRFLLTADAAELRFEDSEGLHAADLVFTAAQKAEDGRIVSGEIKKLNFRLPEVKYRALLAGGMRLEGTVVVDPAATQVRFALLDGESGRVGSVDVPIAEIAPEAASGDARPKPTL